MKIVVAITGASGSVYGIRLLEEMNKIGIETHLIISSVAQKTIEVETSFKPESIKGSKTYHPEDIGASIASGSFRHDGMVIAPCSMKTLSAIANGYSDNLISRAADVTIKEHRKLVLLVRETPLNAIHLENMLKLARLGVVIMPPVPSFYNLPDTINDIIDQTVGRTLDCLDIENNLVKRWTLGS